jgi:hypothetical protein
MSKSRHSILLDKSIEAAISAIELYNKPNFLYREESFSILMINAWELLLKAKLLKDNKNSLKSIYLPLKKNKKDGTTYKINRYKTSRTGNYVTSGIFELLEKAKIDKNLRVHLETLIEIRDNAIHFINSSKVFEKSFLDIATASLKGYSIFIKDNFNRSLDEYNLFIIPIAFDMPSIFNIDALKKETPEHKKLLDFLSKQRAKTDIADKYDVALNINLKLTRGKEGDLTVRFHPNGIPIVQESEEIFKNKYPLDYEGLIKILKDRYADFKCNNKFHEINKKIRSDEKFSKPRLLDFDNPKSLRKIYYSSNIVTEFDAHYTLKKSP